MILLAGGAVGSVVLHLWLGRHLGNARYLAGRGPPWILPNFPYFSFGYPIVLVPAHVLFRDPERLFLAIRVTKALLAASVLPLLCGFCRKRGITGRDLS